MKFNSSEQNIGWFRDQYRSGGLIIKPPFQRKPVWAVRQKCYLIETVLFGLPIPEIYIQQTASVDGVLQYAVVDGQQRIRSVLQYIGSEQDPGEQVFNKFALDKLDANSKWYGKSFAELTAEEKERFYLYRFTVRYLDTKDDEDIRDMFRRLNRFLTPLKPQELRNATFTGPFIKLAENLAEDKYWTENGIITTAAIRRMNDVEFISELLIGLLHGPQSGSAKVIDQYYTTYEDYDDEFPEQRRAQKLFSENLRFIKDVLPDIKEMRWSNKTDFYTLFVVLAFVRRPLQIKTSALKQVRKALSDFETEVEKRLTNKEAKVSKQAADYVAAVEKGANDKQRRATRHTAMQEILNEHLEFEEFNAEAGANNEDE